MLGPRGGDEPGERGVDPRYTVYLYFPALQRESRGMSI